MTTKRIHRVGVGLVAVVAATTGIAAIPATAGPATAGPDQAGPNQAGTAQREWQPRQLVAADDLPKPDYLGTNDYLAVVAPDGRVTAVWIRSRRPAAVLMAHREPGGEWGEPIAVASDRPSSLGDVVVDGQGHVTVVWDQYVPADEAWQSLVRTWQPGDGFGPTTLLGRGAAGPLATNERGDLMATWGNVKTAFKPADGQWQEQQSLPGGWWSLAMNGQGRTYAVVDRQGVIQMAAFNAQSNRWRDPRTVADLHSSYANPSIAANEAGDLIIAWTRVVTDDDTYIDGGAGAIYRPAGGAFGHVHRLYAKENWLGTEWSEVAVDIDSNGVGHVAWVRPDDYFSGRLFAARRKADGGWSKPKLLARDVEDLSVDLSANPSGAVLVTGVRADNRHRLFAVHRRSGGLYQSPVRLSGAVTKTLATSDLSDSGTAVVLYSPTGERQLYARGSER